MCNTFFKKAGAGLLGAPLAVIGGGLAVAGLGVGVVLVVPAVIICALIDLFVKSEPFTYAGSNFDSVGQCVRTIIIISIFLAGFILLLDAYDKLKYAFSGSDLNASSPLESYDGANFSQYDRV